MRFRDLPTTQDLLRKADLAILANLILDRADEARIDRGKKPGKKDLGSARTRVKTALREMRGMPLGKKRDSNAWCLFPCVRFHDADGAMRMRIVAELVKRSDFDAAGWELENFRMLRLRNDPAEWRDGRRAEHSAKGSGEGMQTGRALRTCAYEFDPWDKMLGFRVWMGGGGIAAKGAITCSPTAEAAGRAAFLHGWTQDSGCAAAHCGLP